MRGARSPGSARPSPVAALDHATSTVLKQLAVAARSNKIPAVRELLGWFELTSAVVTVDAIQAQTDTVTAITDTGVDYVFTVVNNTPSLRAAIKALPWAAVPAHRVMITGNGRRATRMIKVLRAPEWIGFTDAVQIAQVRFTMTTRGARTVEVVYLITSADHHAAPRPCWLPGLRATGVLRTNCTGFAMSPVTRTVLRFAPVAPPRSWPACATSPSACCAWPVGRTSPPLFDITPETPPDPLTCCWPYRTRSCRRPESVGLDELLGTYGQTDIKGDHVFVVVSRCNSYGEKRGSSGSRV